MGARSSPPWWGAWYAETVSQHFEDLLLRDQGGRSPLSEGACAKRRAEFFSGRWCARKAICQLTDSDHPIIGMRPDGLPDWPPGLIGSISHSATRAVAVVAAAEECLAIGVDVQDRVPPETAARVSGFVLSLPEAERCRASLGEPWFEVMFSAKETLFKGLFPRCGKYFGHREVEAMAVDGTNRVVSLALCNNVGYWRRGQRFRVRYEVFPNRVFTWMCLRAGAQSNALVD